MDCLERRHAPLSFLSGASGHRGLPFLVEKFYDTGFREFPQKRPGTMDLNHYSAIRFQSVEEWEKSDLKRDGRRAWANSVQARHMTGVDPDLLESLLLNELVHQVLIYDLGVFVERKLCLNDLARIVGASRTNKEL